MANPLDSFTKIEDLPWSTWGRRESTAEMRRHLEQQSERSRRMVNPPRFDLWLDSTDADDGAFSRTYTSLLAQSYPHWRLFVPAARAGAERDPRILAMADGDPREFFSSDGAYVGRVSAGDVLSPVALYFAALELSKHPGVEFFHSHEVIWNPEGNKFVGFISRRPANLFDLRQFDSIGRFWLARRTADLSAENWREERDFLFRCLESGPEVVLCPLALYYRTEDHFEVTQSRGNDCSILSRHLQRSNYAGELISVETTHGKLPRVRPRTDTTRKVSAIICFRDRAELMVECLPALEGVARAAGSSVELEVFLVDNDSQREERTQIEAIAKRIDLKVTWIDFPGAFNFAAMHNQVVRDHARGDLLLLLNNDVFLSPTVDLAEWAESAMAEDAGTVGILLRYPDGRVQHAGMRAYFGGEARLARVGNHQGEDPFTFVTREVHSNSFAAVMVRRSVYESVGGLRELEMVNGFGDLVFNFECLRRGWHNRFLGHFHGVHHEGASRGAEFEYWEERSLEREFPDLLAQMLREEHGWNRTPGGDLDLKAMVWQWAKLAAREGEWLEWAAERGLDPRRALESVSRVLSLFRPSRV